LNVHIANYFLPPLLFFLPPPLPWLTLTLALLAVNTFLQLQHSMFL